MNCHLWKAGEAFEVRDLNRWTHRVCTDCNEKRVCRGRCGQALSRHEFTETEWKEAAKSSFRRGKRKNCMQYGRQQKPCSKCKQMKEVAQFSARMKKEADEHRICLACQRHRSKPNTWKCIACKKAQPKSQFSQ
eukprot:1811408-Karenia_brevis.AAC.1